MKKTIFLSDADSDYYDELLSLTGADIYAKYGLKQGDVIIITETEKFTYGIEAVVRLVIGDGESRPYTEAIGFEKGQIFDRCKPRDTILGEWVLVYQLQTPYVVSIKKMSDDCADSYLGEDFDDWQ